MKYEIVNNRPFQEVLDYQEAGDNDRAVEAAEKILEQDLDNDEANNFLAFACADEEKYGQAIKLIARAINKRPSEASYHNNLAFILCSSKQYDNALLACNKAISLNPNNGETYVIKGRSLRELGEMEKALDSFLTAKGFMPKFLKLRSELGDVLAILGRFEEAEEEFRELLKLSPGNSSVQGQLSSLTIKRVAHSDIEEMEASLKKPDIGIHEKATLLFGLGNAYEKYEEYDKAFECFKEANCLRRESYDGKYAFNKEVRRFKKVTEIVNKDLVNRLSGHGCRDKTPIFILGMPRSGTTLTEQILSSHSNVYGAGELDCLGKIIQKYCFEKNRRLPAGLELLKPEELGKLGTLYIEKLLQHGDKSSPYITDKMPGNFFHVGMIYLALPNAKVIYCRRDPVDICLSVYKHNFNDGHMYSTDLHEVGAYNYHFRQLMDHWQNLLPGFMHVVQYEDMVADQEVETRKMLEFCGLTWDENCLQFHKSKRAIRTLSLTQVRQPIYSRSVQLWKHYERHLGPLLDAIQLPERG
jgi:tetratricopeptide (TPR) repeat protein